MAQASDTPTVLKVKNGISYELMSLDDAEHYLQLYREHFFPREPFLSNFVDRIDYLNSPEIGMIGQGFIQESYKQGLPIVAKDNGKVIAGRITLINKRSEPTIEEEMAKLDLSQVVKEIFGFNAYLETKTNIYEKYSVDEYAHFVGLVCEPGHEGKGIAQTMMNVSYDILRKKGIKIVKVETAQPAVIHILKKHQFEKIHSMPMSEFEVDGKPLVNKSTEFSIWVKKL